MYCPLSLDNTLSLTLPVGDGGVRAAATQVSLLNKLV